MKYNSAVCVVLLSFGCATTQVAAPPDPVALSDEEKRQDPIPAATKLLEQRETPRNLDRAVALLQWHLDQHPDSVRLHELLAEAHARSCEALDLNKSEDQAPHKEHRTEGLRHGEQAVKLDPRSGAAHYWYAANLLHAADAERSLSRAKEALRRLDQADELAPKVDAGGPSRMRGKVLQDMPGLFGGSTSKAIASYRRSLEMAPDCITTHLWLGQAYLDAKKPDLARKEFEWVAAAKTRAGHEKEDAADKQKAQELIKKLEAK